MQKARPEEAVRGGLFRAVVKKARASMTGARAGKLTAKG